MKTLLLSILAAAGLSGCYADYAPYAAPAPAAYRGAPYAYDYAGYRYAPAPLYRPYSGPVYGRPAYGGPSTSPRMPRSYRR